MGDVRKTNKWLNITIAIAIAICLLAAKLIMVGASSLAAYRRLDVLFWGGFAVYMLAVIAKVVIKVFFIDEEES